MSNNISLFFHTKKGDSMTFIYLFIFLSKIVENALATLRLIVVANGKKWLGAILQFCISLVWITVTGTVVINVHKDPFKIFFFALGSFVGSYVGSYIEEKVAMGSNMLLSIVDQNLGNKIATNIREKGFAVTVLHGEGKEKKRDILMVIVPRKKRHLIIDVIQKLDHQAFIVSENASLFSKKFHS